MLKLSEKQKKFCKFRAQGFTLEESAVKAGYSPLYAKNSAYKILEPPQVKKEYERLLAINKKVADEKFSYSAEQSFKKLCEIQELALSKDDKGNFNNLSVAVKAEELKAKLFGCFILDNNQKIATINMVSFSTTSQLKFAKKELEANE